MQLNENAFLGLNYVLRELLCNPRFGSCHYVSFIQSNRDDHLQMVLPKIQKPPKARAEDFQFKLAEFPMQWRSSSGDGRLANVGQGARGYLVSIAFAKHLLQTRLTNWYDLWMAGQRVRFGNDEGAVAPARFLHPPIGAHPVVMADTTRGSDRMTTHLPTTAARFSPYITLALDKGWGTGNRLLTMAVMLEVANALGVGLHVYWPANEACPGLFTEINAAKPLCAELPGLPFVQVHGYSHHFNAFKSARLHQNQGNFRFQTTIELAKQELARVLGAMPQVLNPTFQDVRSRSFAASVRHLLPHCWIQEEAQAFLAAWPAAYRHVAIHIRRGDWQKFELQNAETAGGSSRAQEVRLAYEAADMEIEESRAWE